MVPLVEMLTFDRGCSALSLRCRMSNVMARSSGMRGATKAMTRPAMTCSPVHQLAADLEKVIP
jgi:hypothetical protein